MAKLRRQATWVPGAATNAPPSAIGTTSTLMASRYTGVSHIAVLTVFSSLFSMMPTWNCRGRKAKADMERTVTVSQVRV